jgi:hypothetical protein
LEATKRNFRFWDFWFYPPAHLIDFWMQTLKFAGCAGVATGSILVYAYILIYCFKELGLYRIDLSAVVNKYIGETEKNLRRVFDAAGKSGAIFFR